MVTSTSLPVGGKHILVAGAGIGGLTLAAALRRAGIAVTVFERQRTPGAAGAGITVQTNAMRALARVGLDGDVLAAGTTPRTMRIATAAGVMLQDVDAVAAAARFGQPLVTMHRKRLHLALLAHAGAVETGLAVVGYREEADRVVAKLSNDTEVAGDLLVGADGLHSAVRAQLLGKTPLRYSGYTSWRGVCRNDGLVPEDVCVEAWGRGVRFGIVPIGFGEVYWFATEDAPEGAHAANEHAHLLSLFGHWKWPAAALVSATEHIIRTDIHDRTPVTRWTSGRVALLGDAAHPMTPNLGQGGCQAILDAVALTEALSGEPDLAAALARYEARRVAAANGVVTMSQRFGVLAQARSPLFAWARDTLVRLSPSALSERTMAELADPGL
ncbi:salicylate hydroxylase [Deltaproteobacteria bacterium]|nr:salicylate hydroxylase [Deltaproteobacteria bacterium]